MPKQKTHKATLKRIKETKGGRFMMRKVGQDHFNARQAGRKIMNKRRDRRVARENLGAIKKVLPYYKQKKYAR